MFGVHMKIDLFVRSIYAEYPREINRDNWNEWSYEQRYSEWGEYRPPGRDGNTRKLRRLKMREEEFGGLTFDPETNTVYRVDHDGLELLNLLMKGNKVSDVKSLNHFIAEEIDGFIRQLERYDLW